MLGHSQQWYPTIVYGLAHFGKSLLWYSSEILFAFFLTELAGLPMAQMGMILAIGFLVSAAIDVVAGLGLSRWLERAGAAARVQTIGAWLCSAALTSVFVGGWVSPDWRFGYAIIAGIGFRLAYAIYDIPQNALMAIATRDEASRLRVASTRIWFSGAAVLTVAAAVGPMVATGTKEGAADLLFALAGGFAVIAIVSATILAHVLPIEEQAASPVASASHWRPSREFWLLIGVSFLTSIFTPAFSKLEPYFATYALRSAWWGGAIIILMAFGILLGQPFWPRLCARTSSARVLIGAACIQILSLATFLWASTSQPWLAGLAALGFGLGNGGVGMVLWAAFSETVARHPSGRAGIAYGLFLASTKIGLALGSVLIAAVLSATDFRDPANLALVMLMTGIPSVGAALLVLNGLALLAAEKSNAAEQRSL